MITSSTNNNVGLNPVTKALTLSDFSTWSSGSLINVVFTLFVIDNISGATVADAGVSSMLFLIVSAFLNIPLGRMFDRWKGYLDEAYLLSLSSFIRGAALIILAFSTAVWQLHAINIVLGFAKSLNYVSWRILFSRFLDKHNVGEQWGIYDTVVSVGLALAALLGGILGEAVDYKYVLIVGGLMCLIGAIFPLTVVNNVKKKNS